MLASFSNVYIIALLRGIVYVILEIVVSRFWRRLVSFSYEDFVLCFPYAIFIVKMWLFTVGLL